jgi:pimeloyl-ACP methyl ester carboxylesterase
MSGGLTPNERWPAGEQVVVARDVMVAGEQVRIVESGEPGNFPVVLLHGWGASAYNFRGVLASLGKAGYHAIAPDLRGHGWSETQFPPGAWSSEAMATWVKALLDFLGIQRCVVVGQSIGGAIALDAAAMMPTRVVALVLLAPIGFTPVRRVVLARIFRWLHPSTTPRWAVAFILRRIYGHRGRWTDRDLQEYWNPLRRGDVVKAILQSVREFDFTPRDPRLLTLGDSRLIIRFGELDRLIPARAAVPRARQFKSADVAVLDGVGHVPAEEVPDDIVQLILRVASEVRGQSSELRKSDAQARTSEL